MRTPTPTTDGC